jgi:hypothetical protein
MARTPESVEKTAARPHILYATVFDGGMRVGSAMAAPSRQLADRGAGRRAPLPPRSRRHASEQRPRPCAGRPDGDAQQHIQHPRAMKPAPYPAASATQPHWYPSPSLSIEAMPMP